MGVCLYSNQFLFFLMQLMYEYRFVRWDMEPLPQVRNALDSLMRFTHSPSQDKATNNNVRNYFSFKNRARNAFDRVSA